MVAWVKSVIATCQALWQLVPSKTRSFILSQTFAVWTAVATAIAIGYTSPQIACCRTFSSTVTFLEGEWWAIVLALAFGIGPVYRAMQAKGEDPQPPPSANAAQK
jgi:hypothetical protein